MILLSHRVINKSHKTQEDIHMKKQKIISLNRIALTNIIGYSFALITCLLILQGIPEPIQFVMLIILLAFLFYTIFLESSKKREKNG